MMVRGSLVWSDRGNHWFEALLLFACLSGFERLEVLGFV